MIRVVLDTNVVVSSLLSDGSPKVLLDLAFDQSFAWYISEPILAEYRVVLSYPRLQIDPIDARRTIAAIRKTARLVKPSLILKEATDEEDNRFLECAQASKANYLVTGNLRHFPKAWKYTKVVSPRQFLSLWEIQQPTRGNPYD